VERIKRLTDQNVGESQAIFGISAVYWLSLNKSVGGDFAVSLDLPMLFLQGGSDFQVKPDVDFKAWRDILEGKKGCAFKLYEGLNHLFMKTNGKNDITEYDIADSVDVAVLDDIAGWINETFK
jgi:dienelactone hydrolase